MSLLRLVPFALLCCFIISPVAGAEKATMDDDVRAIREEVKTLKHLVRGLFERIESLEKRLDNIDPRDERLTPWEGKQPFYWDALDWDRHPSRQR